MSNFISDPVESEIINCMRKKDCTIDTVNNYGDNLLHVGAANDCQSLIKEILKRDCREIDLQNDCGWTPLMQAIRNGNIETVKLLLENGCNVERSAFQGISAIALAAAIGREMFEIVHEACPSALENSKNDYVTPLCIAAMKNDEELFFRLLELGLKVSEAGDYTLLMMEKSKCAKISQLGKSHRESDENYWRENNEHDNYEAFSDDEFDVPQMSSTFHEMENSIENHDDRKNHHFHIPNISIINETEDAEKSRTNKSSERMRINIDDKIRSKSLISPRLDYTSDELLAKSPNLCISGRENCNDSGFGKEVKFNWENIDEKVNNFIVDSSMKIVSKDETKKCKFQTKRPPNLQIPKNEVISKGKNGDSPLTGETLIEFAYNTPPKEFPLDVHQKKIAFVLKVFGLTHFVPIFLEQEVDLDLFLTLNDQDLREIGIEKKSDRIILQSVIDECNRNKFII